MGGAGMNYVICDTNIFGHFFIGHESTAAEIQRIGERNILISSVAWMEIIRGSADRKAQTIIEKRISKYTIVHIDENISLRAADLIQTYHLSHGLNIPDALIAATALELELELFTYNLKDFKFIPNIRLYQPANL
ncbi:MAG: type II toxin-antitoxin system VapC family toxin [Saprospiraceae bacterium]|nr:type II toxin-antitoxin system VapC family toxin [Saprospiraceae bacterium]